MAFLSRWPLWRQITQRSDGTGEASMSPRMRSLSARTSDVKTARSVCPYCGVGCGQRIHHDGKRLLAIEGDPDSPISQGTLCPKGAASHQLLTHERRLTEVRYRAPRSTAWRTISLDDAMDMVAERVWDSRARTFQEQEDGEVVRHTTGVVHLGGATLDNEENYLIKKLFTAGLGMVGVSNQARI